MKPRALAIVSVLAALALLLGEPAIALTEASGMDKRAILAHFQPTGTDPAGMPQGLHKTSFLADAGYPSAAGWIQSNHDGFGSPQNTIVATLAPFGASLYAGTYNTSGNGAQLWRKNASGGWIAVVTDGLGDPANNWGINHLMEFDGRLYASTWRWTSRPDGGQVWRSDDGQNWTRVVSRGFGDPTNGEIFRFAVFNDALYASTTSYTTTHGAEIWRSRTGDEGDWERVVANGFGDAQSIAVVSFATFSDRLYAGTWNGTSGGRVWRTDDGETWTPVSAPGLGDSRSFVVSALAAHRGFLYASVGHWSTAWDFDSMDGIQIWRCQACDGSDWDKVVDLASWPERTGEQSALQVLQDHLYLVVGNMASGLQVWRTADGLRWQQIGFAGFGDPHNTRSRWGNSVTAFAGSLYVGTENLVSGGEVWQYLPNASYLPLIRR